jgi:hypothetical protein
MKESSSRYSVLSPSCKMCGSLKGKLFHATKENTMLKQEVAYLTSHLERAVVSEKMIEDDLNRVEESVAKSTYKLGNNQIHQNSLPIQSKAILQPQERGEEKNSQAKSGSFYLQFCVRAGHLDEFYFCCKRIQKRSFDYARNSYRDEFTDFPPRSYSHAPSRFFHGPNHRSYGFAS